MHPQKDDSSTASDNMELSVSKLGVEASAGSDESNGKCGEASFTSSIKAALEILDREDLEYMLYPAWLDAGDSKASREGVSGDSANEADKRTQTTVGASDSGEEPDAALEKDSSVEPSDDDALYETPQGRRRRLGQEKAALRSADNKVTGGAPTAATEISGTNPDSPSGKFKIFVTLGASPTGPSDSEQLQTGQNESGGESSRKNAGSDEATQLPNEEKPQNERQGAGVCSKVAALEDKGSDGGASIMGTISAQMGGQIDSDDELIDSEVFRVLGSILGNSDTIPTKSFSEFGPDGELDASFALALELAEMEGGLDVQRAVMTDAFSSQGIFARQDATKNGSLFPSASSVGNNYYGTDNSYISRSNPFQSNNIGAVQSETRIPSASGPAPTTAIEDDDWEASLALMIQLAEAEGGLDNQRESLAKLGLLEEDPNLPRTCSVCIELQPLQNLLQLPCERHYICSDTGCLESTFTPSNENLIL